MSTKTVHNLNLINLEMYEVLETEDYKGLKALSHSYETLLIQLNYKHEDFEKEIIRNQIAKQIKLTTQLHEKLETISIPKLLGERNYIEVNHLTTAVARLNTINSKLTTLRLELCRRHNPNIGLISDTKEGSEYLWNALIQDRNEDVLFQKGYYNQNEIVTSVNNYTHLFSVTEQMRGSRFDHLYIDSKLDVKTKSLCMSFVKDKENIKFF